MLKWLKSFIEDFDLLDLIMLVGIILFGYGIYGIAGIHFACIGVGSAALLIGMAVMLKD